MSISRRGRALLTLATGNWPSRVYLAGVAATTGYFLYDTLVSHPDASMSAILPWLVTAPVSLVSLVLPGGTPTGPFTAVYFAGIAAGAVTDAALIGAVVRWVGPSRPSRPSSRNAAAGA
ncbi:SCO4225 family membrane protein [Streptomyces sp. TS71-3]|uniref:SCO4225 family membrane protein n=1 Tax=Streptomyces sp. TS71-3 TaxID=2733862 RepID=UPI001B063E14|nr:hypothetical protein [Streptomyces sp. TS71-3]GHJ34770.1 hypothetical protein Sm713_03790 [Streptomyces sp. TS71-3]